MTLAGCGKKGPPLEPLRFQPNQPADMVGRRVGDAVELRFALPTQNASNVGRIDLDRVEIYAVTIAAGTVIPPNRDLMTRKYLVKTVPVKPLPEEGEEPAKDDRPLPGEMVTFVEPLTVAETTPALLPKPPVGNEAAAAAMAAAPLDPPVPMRIYVARGFSRKGNPGAPSIRASIPLIEAPPAPADVTPQVTETSLVLTWTAPMPIVEPVAAARAALAAKAAEAAAAMPPPKATSRDRQKPRPPASADAPLPTFIETATLKVIPGFALPIAPPAAFAFNVYTHADGKTSETPINEKPLLVARLERTEVPWDQEQCFVIRSVRLYGNVTLESASTDPVCVTPHDTFAPAAPTGLRGVALVGAINLSWNANTEKDLAGYLVLRGEAPGDKLQALTPAPITETNYRDPTVKRGVRYVYAIVAVDKATPPNMSAQSARYEEVAR